MKKFFTIAILAATVMMFAEMKLGYINSDKVLADYNDAKKAKEELAKWNKDMEGKAVTMENEIKALEEEIKNMSVMVSEEKRNEKMAQGQKKLQEYYQYKDKVWGQSGDFYKKNSELMQPILDKINAVIKQVSEKEKFDYVFDANTGTLLFAKPEYEITDLIIKELNK
jgi:outer membrane protein